MLTLDVFPARIIRLQTEILWKSHHSVSLSLLGLGKIDCSRLFILNWVGIGIVESNLTSQTITPSPGLYPALTAPSFVGRCKQAPRAIWYCGRPRCWKCSTPSTGNRWPRLWPRPCRQTFAANLCPATNRTLSRWWSSGRIDSDSWCLECVSVDRTKPDLVQFECNVSELVYLRLNRYRAAYSVVWVDCDVVRLNSMLITVGIFITWPVTVDWNLCTYKVIDIHYDIHCKITFITI